MIADDRPEGMRDAGLRPRLPVGRYDVPPTPPGLRVEREFDQAKADRLVADFEKAIGDAAEPSHLEALRIRLLDAMTANRISSLQASRLIAAVLRRLEGTDHELRRISPDGADAPFSFSRKAGVR